MQKGFAVLFSLILLGQCLILRRRHGTWVFPATLFSLFWFLELFFPLILFWDVPAEPLAIAYIAAALGAFALGSIGFDWDRAFAVNRALAAERPASYDTPFLRRAFYGMTAVVLAFAVINSQLQGFPLGEFLANPMETSGQYAAMRYAEELTRNLFGQVSVVLTYVVVPLGGLLFAQTKSRLTRATIIVLSFAPSVLVMLMQSAKGMLLLVIVLFYGAVLVARMRNGDMVLVQRRSIPGLIVIGAVIFVLVVTSFLSRGLHESDDTGFILQHLTAYVASYTSGHVYGFSDWFSDLIGKPSVNYYAPYAHSWGFYEFMPIFQALGDDRLVPQGVYDEYFTHGELFSTNIYTVFRGLIVDFGVVGSLVYMLLTGWLSHAAYHRLLTERRPVVSAAVFVFLLGYMYTTLIINLFIWPSVYASFAVLCVVLYANERFAPQDAPAPSPDGLATART